MMKRERRPMETYNDGGCHRDGCQLHDEMDSHRDAARRYRVGAFWLGSFQACTRLGYGQSPRWRPV